MINEGFGELSCKLTNDNNDMIIEYVAISKLMKVIHVEIGEDHFTLSSMKNLTKVKFAFDHLQVGLEESNKSIYRCVETIIKMIVLARHIGGTNPRVVQESIYRFEAFIDGL